MGDIEKFNQILKELNEIYFEKEKTIFEVTKYPYRETVSSNILAFYFDIKEEHGLRDLFLRALIKTVNNQIDSDKIKIDDNTEIDNIEVETEYTTAENKRIDLVLYNQNFAIGIENKIGASLYNNLEEYSKTIDKKNENNYKIVLSVRKEKTREGFINVIYKDFFVQVNEILNKKFDVNNKWHIFLKEFMQTIEKIEGDTIMNNNLIDWYTNNENDIQKLLNAIESIKDYLDKKVDELGEALDEKIISYGYKTGRYNYGKTGIYNKNRYLDSICNINLDKKYHITIDNVKSLNKWIIQINCGTIANREKIYNTLKENGIADAKYFEVHHLKLWEFANDIDYNKIIDKNIKLLEIFK